MKRVAVVGTTGSGKTTLAGRLAPLIGATCIDLDALLWGPNWTQTPAATMRKLLEESLSAPAWVVAGNSRKLRDLIWGRADTLMWLDYPLAVVLWRLWWRTWRRILTREELWSDNRESVHNQFLSRDSLLLYAIQTHEKKRQLVLDDLQ